MNRYGVFGCAVMVAWFSVRPSSAPQIPSTTPGSQCAVADDPNYAYTREQAVQVGGGAMFVASRERRYLDALRGSGGEPVRYKRTSTTTLEPNALTIIDVYEVTYDGAERPVTIYLDAYHFDDGLRAPKGFTCVAPIGLNPPGPDLFQASRYLLILAVGQSGSRDVAPIPLDTPGSDGKARRGVLLDHFRMMARVMRAAAAAGKPIVLDPAVRPPDSLRQRTVVVAYPLSCEGRTIAPQSIDLLSSQGQQAPRQGDYASGEALSALIPGLEVPAGSVAATFGVQAPRPNDAVRITYAESCGGTGDVTVPLQQTPLRPLSTPEPTLPEGVTVSSDTIRLQAQVDLDGALQHVTYVGGPRELLQAAIQAVRTWTVDPVRINNAPISTPVVLQVRFLPRPGPGSQDPGLPSRHSHHLLDCFEPRLVLVGLPVPHRAHRERPVVAPARRFFEPRQRVLAVADDGVVTRDRAGDAQAAVVALRLSSLLDTLPLKFGLSAADGTSANGATATLRVEPIGPDNELADPLDVDLLGAGDDGNVFRLTGNHYHFNLRTHGWSPGRYRLTVTLNDGRNHWIEIVLR